MTLLMRITAWVIKCKTLLRKNCGNTVSQCITQTLRAAKACGQCHNDCGSWRCVAEQFSMVIFKQDCGARDRVDYDRKSYLISQTILLWHTTPLLGYKAKWWQAQLKISQRLRRRHRVETNVWLQSSVCVTKRKTCSVTQTQPDLWCTQTKHDSVRKPLSHLKAVLMGIFTRFESFLTHLLYSLLKNLQAHCAAQAIAPLTWSLS